MKTARPSTAEIVAAIDGYYDDFVEHSNDEVTQREAFDAGQPAIEDAIDDHQSLVEKARQESHDLLERHADLSSRAKRILLKREQGRPKPKTDPSKLSEAETRFRAALKRWPQIQQEKKQNERSYINKIEQLETTLENKQQRVKEIRDTFHNFCLEISSDVLKTKTSLIQEVKHLLDESVSAAAAMHDQRLESIAIESENTELEKKMTDRDRLGEGLHLVDFEQLKIENQTLHEKIDERNQELIQFKKKTCSIVQVLTHVCEKLHFMDRQVQQQVAYLRDASSFLANRKIDLQHAKTNLSAIKQRTVALDQRCLKVMDIRLLSDIKRLSEAKTTLTEALDRLRKQHANKSA